MFFFILAATIFINAVPSPQFSTEVSCEIASAAKITGSVHQSIKFALEDRWGWKCLHRPVAVAETFYDFMRREESQPLRFWIEAAPRDDGYILRAVDGVSRLQWARAEFRLEGLSESSKILAILKAFEDVMAAHPYVGWLEKEEFSLWLGEEEKSSLAIVARGSLEPHPYLPQILKWGTPTSVAGKADVSRSQTDSPWQWSWNTPPQKPLGSERLWLIRQ